MLNPTQSDRYKAQLYDVVLNAFFRLRDLDSEALKRSKTEVGWDIAEALVAAAISGVTYKTTSTHRQFEAAQLLRQFADMVEEDGLASLGWGYRGNLDARHAWRPDIRSSEGREEVEGRAAVIIKAMYGPLSALTVLERQAIVCLAFARAALGEALGVAGDMNSDDPAKKPVVDAINDLARAATIASKQLSDAPPPSATSV